MDIVNSEFKFFSVPEIVEKSLKNKEGVLAENGALVVKTGDRTGRSPKERYIIEDAKEIDWNETNKSTKRETFEKLWDKTLSYLDKKQTYTTLGYVGADANHRLSLKVISEKAWHSLFAKTLFICPDREESKKIKPDFVVVDAMDLKLNKEDGLGGEVFIGLDLLKKRVLIIGSGYGGEIKKAIFTVMNYLLPDKKVFPMHCSSNVGSNGDCALFFGLSGTGKTTLSADPKRRLVGDDEHGWTDDGIFNFEGGCYAKVIKLSAEKEPQIYKAIKFGSILENVVIDEDRKIDYDDSSITENTRATYPLGHIPDVVFGGKASQPKNVFFLTCDAFGVLPPISELTPEMAMYHFLSGYTAKVAGTEAGITEPTATFSTCFGAPFMLRHPTVYAKLLGEKMKKFGTKLWLVNTGWSGGPFGVGKRMDIDITRALLNSALEGKLDNVEKTPHPVFKVLVPKSCVGVDSKVLNPKDVWVDKNAYDEKAKHLAKLFGENFKKYSENAGKEIVNAGPMA